MVQYVFGRSADRVMTINITPGDMSVAANQTATDIKWTLPAGNVIVDAYIQNTGGTVTSTGTLTNLYATLGVTSTGVGYIAQTDLKAAGTVGTTVAAAAPGIATTDTTIYASFAPNGSGSNWNTLTFPVAATATQWVVTIVYRNVASGGDSLR